MQTHAAHPPLRHAALAMGTRFEMVAYHSDATLARAAAEAAFDEVLRLHALWSPFENSSTIARVNSSGGSSTPVDRDTLDLLLAARRLWRDTGGRFDPTVGALMRWWGFRGEDCSRARGESRPGVGMHHVEIDEAVGTVRLNHPEIRLDLGAIGKGAALDAAGRILRDAGIESALLHAGTSSILAIGTPPGSGERWRVRVGDHADAPEVVLQDESLSVSEASGRTVEVGNATLGHVLDPRTGEPARGARLAAVVCRDAMKADAWSTALLVDSNRPGEEVARWAYVVPVEL